MSRLLRLGRRGLPSFFRWCMLLLVVTLSLQYGFNVRVFVSYRTTQDQEVTVSGVNWSEIVLPGGVVALEQPLHVRHPLLAKAWRWMLGVWGVLFGLSPCPVHPPSGAGPIPIEEGWFPMPWMENQFGDVEAGGRWRPTHCQPRHKVAVIVPYRNRDVQLRIFLHHMHPFLQRQLLDYTIFLIEQTQEYEFNRGLLLNAGFREAQALDDYNCFILHDVDMLPEDDRIPYACHQDSVVHLSVALSRTNYTIPYKEFLGGVLATTKEQYSEANGYSNAYFGWGAEDDDLYKRLKHVGTNIYRKSDSGFIRFKTVKHVKQKINRKKDRYLKHWFRRWRHDGLSSLTYTVMEQLQRPLYSWFLVAMNQSAIMDGIDYYMPGGRYKYKNRYWSSRFGYPANR